MRVIELHPYDEQWANLFEDEARVLCTLFGEEILEIHHIGSTAVPGLHAKPTIDILPVVRSIARVDCFTEAMERMGYQAKGENGIPGRRYFCKGGERRTHHVHFYEVDDSRVVRHLAFRDYLRTHPNDAESYGKLKQSLAHAFPHDSVSYVEGKAKLAKEIEMRAIEWYRTQSDPA